jgi:hypothetical protein
MFVACRLTNFMFRAASSLQILECVALQQHNMVWYNMFGKECKSNGLGFRENSSLLYLLGFLLFKPWESKHQYTLLLLLTTSWFHV